MATSRESQGLIITVILLTMLTVGLGVATYMLNRNWQDEQIKVTKNEAETTKARDEAKQLTDENEGLRKLLGADGDLKKVQEAFDNSMKEFAPTAKEVTDYPQMVKFVHEEFVKANGQILTHTDAEMDLQKQLDNDHTTIQTNLATYDQANKKVGQDLAGERAKFNDSVTKMKADSGALAKKMDEKRDELKRLADKTSDDLHGKDETIRKLDNLVKAMKGHDEAVAAVSGVVDGKITWVNQKAKVVWLNLGTDDGLKRQVSFTVIGPDETNPTKAPKKGNIEVTRLLDRHLSEARILDDNVAKPLMPGDKIFSVAWKPGQTEHIALAGLMNINGKADAKKVHDLISLNGGVIDAEVTADGKKIGEITVNTRYLVLGDAPTDKTANQDLLKNYSKIIGEANSMGTRTMSLRDFLDRVGYTGSERTTPLLNSDPNDFKPTFPNGVQRKSAAKPFDFKERRPPVTEKKSAY